MFCLSCPGELVSAPSARGASLECARAMVTVVAVLAGLAGLAGPEERGTCSTLRAARPESEPSLPTLSARLLIMDTSSMSDSDDSLAERDPLSASSSARDDTEHAGDPPDTWLHVLARCWELTLARWRMELTLERWWVELRLTRWRPEVTLRRWKDELLPRRLLAASEDKTRRRRRAASERSGKECWLGGWVCRRWRTTKYSSYTEISLADDGGMPR